MQILVFSTCLLLLVGRTPWPNECNCYSDDRLSLIRLASSSTAGNFCHAEEATMQKCLEVLVRQRNFWVRPPKRGLIIWAIYLHGVLWTTLHPAHLVVLKQPRVLHINESF